MRRFITLGLVAFSALTIMAPTADAQNRRRVVVQDEGALLLRVRPRSFLEPGNVVQVGELDRTTSGAAQTRQYLVSPPWSNMRDRFGEGTLPDPVHGTFIGARNPFGPVDYVAPPGLR
ncbi:MAG TPA: hypothetical protein VIL09_17480 [Microvirga sp.]|jgi:hypothetical protein